MSNKQLNIEDAPATKPPNVRVVIASHQDGDKPPGERATSDLAHIQINVSDDSKNLHSIDDQASTITLIGSIGDLNHHRDHLPGQLQILRHVVEILFLKPEQQVLDPCVMYDMRSGDDQRLFYVVWKAPAKFHGRFDVHIVDRETGQSHVRLVSSKLNPYKLHIKHGKTLLGIVTQTNWVLCLPKFVIRDSFRNEIALIRTKFELNTCCINCPQCCCQLSSGMFEIFRRKDPVSGKMLTREIKLGTIGRIDHDDEEEDITGSLLGINFEFDGLEVQERCLLVAATLFLDFNLFGNTKPTSPYYILFGLVFFVIVITGAVIAFIKF